jgi:hypothetical protein
VEWCDISHLSLHFSFPIFSGAVSMIPQQPNRKPEKQHPTPPHPGDFSKQKQKAGEKTEVNRRPHEEQKDHHSNV